jgi:hypothetical protein
VREEEREPEEERERLRARADVRDGLRVDGVDGEEERAGEGRAARERERPEPGEEGEAGGRVKEEVSGVEPRGPERIAREELVRPGVSGAASPLRERPVERLVVEPRREVPAAPHREDVERPAEQRLVRISTSSWTRPCPERRGEAGDRRECDEERGPRAAEPSARTIGRRWLDPRMLSRAFHARGAALGSRSRGEG